MLRNSYDHNALLNGKITGQVSRAKLLSVHKMIYVLLQAIEATGYVVQITLSICL